MDINKVLCNDYTASCLHKEAMPNTTLNAMLKIKQTSFSGLQTNCEEDALKALKQDPAVLDVQVTLTDKEYNADDSIRSNESIENEVQSSDETAAAARGPRPTFEQLVSIQEAALMSLPPEQLCHLLLFTDSLRKKRVAKKKILECAFCKNNGESVKWYRGHVLKDSAGRVRCPVLRDIQCPLCGATGNRAHTIKYCPENNNNGLF